VACAELREAHKNLGAIPLSGKGMLERVGFDFIVCPTIGVRKQINGRGVPAISESWCNPECINAICAQRFPRIDASIIDISSLCRNIGILTYTIAFEHGRPLQISNANIDNRRSHDGECEKQFDPSIPSYTAAALILTGYGMMCVGGWITIGRGGLMGRRVAWRRVCMAVTCGVTGMTVIAHGTTSF
jgi:hypothetical protein